MNTKQDSSVFTLWEQREEERRGEWKSGEEGKEKGRGEGEKGGAGRGEDRERASKNSID